MRFRRLFELVMVAISVTPLVGCQVRLDPFLLSADWAEKTERSGKFGLKVEPLLPEEAQPDQQKGRFEDLDKLAEQEKKNLEETSETAQAIPLPELPPEWAGRIGGMLKKVGDLRETTALVEKNLRSLKPMGLTPTSESGRATVRDLEALDEVVSLLEKQLVEISTDLAAFKEGQRVHREVVDERLRQLENRMEALERHLLQSRAEQPQVTAASGKQVVTPQLAAVHILVPNATPPAFYEYTHTFPCGTVLKKIIPAAGEILHCPIHNNPVFVKPK